MLLTGFSLAKLAIGLLIASSVAFAQVRPRVLSIQLGLNYNVWLIMVVWNMWEWEFRLAVTEFAGKHPLLITRTVAGHAEHWRSVQLAGWKCRWSSQQIRGNITLKVNVLSAGWNALVIFADQQPYKLTNDVQLSRRESSWSSYHVRYKNRWTSTYLARHRPKQMELNVPDWSFTASADVATLIIVEDGGRMQALSKFRYSIRTSSKFPLIGKSWIILTVLTPKCVLQFRLLFDAFDLNSDGDSPSSCTSNNYYY